MKMESSSTHTEWSHNREEDGGCVMKAAPVERRRKRQQRALQAQKGATGLVGDCSPENHPVELQQAGRQWEQLLIQSHWPGLSCLLPSLLVCRRGIHGTNGHSHHHHQRLGEFMVTMVEMPPGHILG